MAKKQPERRSMIEERNTQATPATPMPGDLDAVTLVYDYEQISPAHRELVRAHALAIKSGMKRTAKQMLDWGDRLNQIKEVTEHGQFGELLKIEFGFDTDRLPQLWMASARRLAERSDAFTDLPPSALYLLGAKSTPEAALDEIEDTITAPGGTQLSLTGVREIVAAHKRPSVITVASIARFIDAAYWEYRQSAQYPQELIAGLDASIAWFKALSMDLVGDQTVTEINFATARHNTAAEVLTAALPYWYRENGWSVEYDFYNDGIRPVKKSGTGSTFFPIQPSPLAAIEVMDQIATAAAQEWEEVEEEEPATSGYTRDEMTATADDVQYTATPAPAPPADVETMAFNAQRLAAVQSMLATFVRSLHYLADYSDQTGDFDAPFAAQKPIAQMIDKLKSLENALSTD